jgi:hypothetical protein
MAEKPRLKLPKEANKGDIIEIKTLLAHIMESGQRKDKDGKTIRRKIVNKFACDKRQAGAVDLEPAIAANPTCSSMPRSKKVVRSNSHGPTTTVRSQRQKKTSP